MKLIKGIYCFALMVIGEIAGFTAQAFIIGYDSGKEKMMKFGEEVSRKYPK